MSSNDAVNFCSSENEAASISDGNGEIIMEEDFETIHVEQQDVATITNHGRIRPIVKFRGRRVKYQHKMVFHLR